MVFSLEHQGRVIGRQSLSCRICSCPKRDKKSQENAYMKKSIQQNPDVQSPNNLPYVPLKKKPKLMYHPQHNSILKQPSVIEQIAGKRPSLLKTGYQKNRQLLRMANLQQFLAVSCQLHKYISQNLGSDGHLEGLNMLKSQLNQNL